MAENFYSILTAVGLAKIANAQVSGNKVDLTQIAVGDGGGTYYNPTQNDTHLKNEVWRGNIGSVEIDPENPNWIVIESYIPSTVGGFTVREVGIFDAEGDMIAIGKYPETFKPSLEEGASKDLLLRMIIEVTNASAVTMKVDPSVIIASRKYVDEKVGVVSNNLMQLQQEFMSHSAEIVQPYYEFWVNSDIGDDNNDGKTSSTPFATIKKAIDSVPNGVQGQIRLFGNSPHVIDQDIYLYNKNINLLPGTTVTINKLSSARIYVINSSLTGGYQHNWYVEDILFHVAGLSSISLGGHGICTIRPLSKTSNVTVCYLAYSYSSGWLQGHPSFLSFTGRRLRFSTDNFPTYSGTYNVFQKALESGIIVSKFWELTKDETVNWGLTENVLGNRAGGLSQWY